MGLENIESLNDNTELFIRLFKEGDCKKMNHKSLFLNMLFHLL